MTRTRSTAQHTPGETVELLGGDPVFRRHVAYSRGSDYVVHLRGKLAPAGRGEMLCGLVLRTAWNRDPGWQMSKAFQVCKACADRADAEWLDGTLPAMMTVPEYQSAHPEARRWSISQLGVTAAWVWKKRGDFTEADQTPRTYPVDVIQRAVDHLARQYPRG